MNQAAAPTMEDAQAEQDRIDAENQEAIDSAPAGGNKIAVPPFGDQAVMDKIEKAGKEMDELDAKAKLINASRNEIREGLEAIGINRVAFQYARQMLGMSDAKRNGLDLSLVQCRRAFKDPMQTDWIAGKQDEGQE